MTILTTSSFPPAGAVSASWQPYFRLIASIRFLTEELEPHNELIRADFANYVLLSSSSWGGF
jgi:hypothetical protein